MKRIGKLAVALSLLACGGAAAAAPGDIIVRARALGVLPDVSASGTLDAINADVDNNVVPELDFTYMFTDNIGAELILATTRNKVTTSAFGGVGKVSLLPPTVTLQYHFNPAGKVRPYAGAGLNFTYFYDNGLAAGGQDIGIEHTSFGPALQAGVDVQINKDWFVNADVKKIWIRTDASLGGADIGRLRIDPWIVGIGVGRRF
ncbi:outer membrane beta-barrel protein [Pigmentiphaga soli]|uniref:Outer membrane beta-barrel protein n=1 Tax=Pigmentiphaga soli TaxID=1007095 RepID=A0ABP8GF78_9BURK